MLSLKCIGILLELQCWAVFNILFTVQDFTLTDSGNRDKKKKTNPVTNIETWKVFLGIFMV